MYQLTHADRIWNRACGESPLRALAGDRALTDLLQAHGYIMNGGVLHAVELLSSSELGRAAAGYAYLGLDAVASLLARASAILKAESELGEQKKQLDAEYVGLIPSDSELVERFKQGLHLAPDDFAPLRPEELL